MMEYLIGKWLHILSSTFLFGTGIGSAFYLLFASMQRDAAIVAFVARHVVIADWLFTATTIVLQPVTGLYLAHLMQMPLDAFWLKWSIVLYIVAGLCWLPVVYLQMKMRDIAAAAAQQGAALPDRYWWYFKAWLVLGFPALFAFLAIFYLMVAKPM
jgi:uncharacterized membrane protein